MTNKVAPTPNVAPSTQSSSCNGAGSAKLQLKAAAASAGGFDAQAQVLAPRPVQRTAPVQLKALQFIGAPLGQELPEGAVAPIGEQKDQRQYTPEQYIEMWEEEQGRPVTAAEKETIERGCVGIVAHNLEGAGNPLDTAVGVFGSFEQAEKLMNEKNAARDWWSRLPLVGQLYSDKRYVLFAKLFWSNQSDDNAERQNPDDAAFLPDPETGEVDMSGYKYRAQTKPDGGSYINFDYGFWDEGSQCFWHANHCRYKDPERNALDPMIVLQSTKEKFAKGYLDFDRIVYGVALANNYAPGSAANVHAGDE